MFQNYDTNQNSNETLERLVAMTNQTNLVALDKVLAAIRRSTVSYAAAAARCGSIGERIVRASYEVGMTLPESYRASVPRGVLVEEPKNDPEVVVQNTQIKWLSWFKK